MSLTLKAVFPTETFVVPIPSNLDYRGLVGLIYGLYPRFYKKDFEIERYSADKVVGAPIVCDAGLALAVSEARLENKPLYIKVGLKVVPGIVSEDQRPANPGESLFESVKLRAESFSDVINPIIARRRRAFYEPEVVQKEAAEVEKLQRCKFVENLNALEQMGFTNRDMNIEVLVQHRGDLLQAVRQLVARAKVQTSFVF